jgi:hypothetical protein
MPLCPQITNTPITVVLNSDFTVTSVIPVLPATTTQVAAAQQSATDAYNTAVAAGTAASTAQTTANGKNKVTYSTSTPGSTANTAGDIWYQYGTASPNVGRIIAQYSGAGGTSWTQTTISGLVVANIDAGSITTGTISVALGITTGSGTFTVNALTGALFADSATITGAITATSGTISGALSVTGSLTGGTIQTSSGSSGVILNGSLNALQFRVSSSISGNIVPLGTAGVLMHYGATPDPTGATFPKVQMSSTTALLQASSSYYIQSTNAGNSALGDFRMFNALQVDGTATMNGDVNLGASQELRVPFAYTSTTGNAASVWISSTGQFRRSTSSIRYKENIVDLKDVPELDPKKLLEIPVRAFSYKVDSVVAGDDRAGILIPGLIAEEVDAIYPLATDYENGRIENINDRAILVNLLALVQDLYKEIATLKGE